MSRTKGEGGEKDGKREGGGGEGEGRTSKSRHTESVDARCMRQSTGSQSTLAVDSECLSDNSRSVPASADKITPRMIKTLLRY